MNVFITIESLISKYFNIFKKGYYPTSESFKASTDDNFNTTDTSSAT